MKQQYSDEHMDDDEGEEQNQRLFYNVGRFDRRKVDLNKPPMTVEEYLKQVIVGREREPAIAFAPNYEQIMQNPKASAPSTSNQYIQLYLNTNGLNTDKKVASRFGPDRDWSMAKSNEFSKNRSMLEAQKAPPLFMKGLKFPAAADSMSWCQVCFERRLEGFEIPQELEENFAHHAGTPPTTKLIKSLNDNQVNHLILHQTEYIIDRGYTRASFEWMYALLLVVKKPLLQEVCAALRKFCRKCREWRAEMNEDELDQIHELSWFIAIISIYFAQRDLADD